jgi:subtilisin-like proprotein convertase family protein
VPGPTCIQFGPTDFPIPDDDPGQLTVSFDNLPTGTIEDLNFCVNIDHTWVGDLTFVLEQISSGIQVQLLDVPGNCSGDNLRIYFDDEAAQSAASVCSNGTPAISGTYRPDEPLSTYDGMQLGGDWQLIIVDKTTPDVGYLRGSYIWWTISQ